MQAEPLIHWPEPILEYIGFVAQFVALGAIGFRYAAVRDRLPLGPNTLHAPDDSERATYARALRRAATLGLFGALVSAALFAYGLPEAAERAKTTVQGLLTTNVRAGAQAALLTIGVLGLLLASTGRRIGWPAALLGMTVAPLTALFVGQWIRLVNPVHRVAGGYWIGTLFVLLVVGIASVWRETPNGGRRGAMVADMVHGFSPLALVAGATVAGSGLITAWRHLNPLASLWTTPYGYALMVKLALVAGVFALGAWNWRRQRPMLGSDEAALSVRRSARAEVTVAALVLAASAIVVSLPSPRPPAAPGAPGGAPPSTGPSGVPPAVPPAAPPAGP